jgi:tetratricopeptide (TPR) repeat protein
MTKQVLTNFLFFLAVFFLSEVNGQNNLVNEENSLKFQNYFFEALKQKAIKNYGKAIENLEKCYQIDSTSTAVEFELSKNYLLQENYLVAELFIDRALKQQPNNLHLLKHKVLIYKNEGNLSKAILHQKNVVKIQPVLNDELVVLYFQNEDYDVAEKLLSEIEKNALSTPKTINYKRYLEEKKIIKSEKNNQNAPIKNSTIAQLKNEFDSGQSFKILKELLNKEANENLFDLLYADSLAALELFPAQPFVYFMNGFALNKLGKYNEAVSVLTIGIDFVIDNTQLEANFYEELANAYNKLNNIKEAQKFGNKAKELRNKM